MRLIFLLAALLLPSIAAPAAAQIFPSSAGDLKVETVAGGLVHPWSLAFLPDGRMLVSERPGRLRIVTRAGQVSPPLSGVPEVYARSQAGLLDVALDRRRDHPCQHAQRRHGAAGLARRRVFRVSQVVNYFGVTRAWS
jgi:glucose/arabinose dehydrogenase